VVKASWNGILLRSSLWLLVILRVAVGEMDHLVRMLYLMLAADSFSSIAIMVW